MGSVRVFQVDAFTTQRFAGNPAGVILDADGLSDRDMRQLARELGSADSAFVLAPEAADHDLRVRFLTPRGEAAFIGHATVAVHRVLASLGSPPQPRQQQRGGLVRVERLGPGSCPRIAIHQAPPPLGDILQPALLAELLAILGLTVSALDPRCPARLAGATGPRVLLAVDTAATLARLQPDLSRLAQLSQRIGVPGIFVFTVHPSLPGVLTEARMFCPALGFPEDPVSGNAHGLLGTYLLQQGLLATPLRSHDVPEGAITTQLVEFTGAQGHHMDRPGRVTVALSLAVDAMGKRSARAPGASGPVVLQSVAIIGEAVIAFATSVPF